jgi:hypothetical protein
VGRLGERGLRGVRQSVRVGFEGTLFVFLCIFKELMAMFSSIHVYK